jgi:hypothetical protein
MYWYPILKYDQRVSSVAVLGDLNRTNIMDDLMLFHRLNFTFYIIQCGRLRRGGGVTEKTRSIYRNYKSYDR